MNKNSLALTVLAISGLLALASWLSSPSALAADTDAWYLGEWKVSFPGDTGQTCVGLRLKEQAVVDFGIGNGTPCKVTAWETARYSVSGTVLNVPTSLSDTPLAFRLDLVAKTVAMPTGDLTMRRVINSDPTQGWALMAEGDRMTDATTVFGAVKSKDQQTLITLGCWTRNGSIMAFSIMSNLSLGKPRLVQYRVDQNPMEREMVQTQPLITLIPPAVMSQLKSGTAKTMLVSIDGTVIDFPVGAQFNEVYEGAQKACQTGNGIGLGR